MPIARHYSALQVADLLGCSEAAARKVIEAAGATRPLGSLVRISEDALQSYLDRCRAPAKDHGSIGAPVAPAGGVPSTENATSHSAKAPKPKRSIDSPPMPENVASLKEWRKKALRSFG